MTNTVSITKFAHSCVLVEFAGQAVLFDPGDYSWNSGTFDLGLISKLDALAITHEHADHFYMPFVEALAQKFPDMSVVATPPVIEQLTLPLASTSSEPTDALQLFPAKHEDLPFRVPGPINTGFHFADVFTHPGDSHSFHETKAVLAMPMTAPWGSMVTAIDKIMELKPKFVLPIHDWQWRPEMLDKFYNRFRAQLAEQGIVFLLPVNGQKIELELA